MGTIAAILTVLILGSAVHSLISIRVNAITGEVRWRLFMKCGIVSD